MASVTAFPLLVDERVEGVLEFYSDSKIIRNGQFLEAMRSVAIQVGSVFERRSVEVHLAETMQRERQKMGQDLHDTLAQQIAGAGILAATLRRQSSKPIDPLLHQRLEESIDEAKKQVRSLTEGLVLVDTTANELRAALFNLANTTQGMNGIHCALVSPARPRVPDDFVATQLLLIAREAVHNAVKHSGATRIVIRLSGQSGPRLSIEDNGTGRTLYVPQVATSMGIKIMYHRARLAGGVLQMRARSEGGTIVDRTRPRRAPR